MKFWNRKNKIEFFHNEPSIIENFPIIEPKDLKLNWVKKAKHDFQIVKPRIDNKPGFIHLTRCPGIFDLFKYGYIIPLHKDIMIKSKGKGFEYGFNNTNPDFFLSPQASSSESNIQLVPIPPWAIDRIFKITTGWHIIAPKGVKFILLPIAYPDTFDFTSTIGIINPALSTAINFQMFWNGTEDTVITAGTPLGHLIPLSEKKFKMVQRIMNQRDLYWVNMLQSAYNTSFWRHTMRKKVSDMYNKYWKG